MLQTKANFGDLVLHISTFTISLSSELQLIVRGVRVNVGTLAERISVTESNAPILGFELIGSVSRRRIVQNPAFSVEDSKVSVATCTATTQMASIFRICGTAGSSPAIFMSKEGTKPRQVESTDLSTG